MRRRHPETPRSKRPRLEVLEDRTVLNGPEVVDPNLGVRTVVSGLDQPTTMAFLGRNDFFVLEKATGKVQRVVNGAVQSTVLDLAVNSGSERGLLGIALHPDFHGDRDDDDHDDRDHARSREDRARRFVYLYWTESTTGADTTVLSETPLLGNRVDRFIWNGSTLTFDRTLIRLRALQPAFEGEPTPAAGRGNHDGGVIRFGPDGKLYIFIGDVGRRGQMQNLPDGHGGFTSDTMGNQPDDNFGGPEPDDAHLTGVILRLNDDGSTPRDNPFFRAGRLKGGEAGANLQKVFAYGIRNGFGMAFDPKSGRLWDAQNGDDSFTELNQVNAGDNMGWVQVMGPIERIAQFREIETTAPFRGLQQARWSPDNIADTAEEALARLFHVFESGKRFAASLTGAEEVPAVATTAGARAEFRLDNNGTMRFRLVATAAITGATQAHLHLGAIGQNGPVVAFLLPFNPAGVNFAAGDVIAEGTLTDATVSSQPTFDGTVAALAQRIREGRVYANLHTLAFPAGEVRGQVVVTDARPVSHYSDPEFSWKFEVAPAAIGFLDSRALGREYEGDLFVGAARDFLEGGNLFRFNLTGNRRRIAVDDPRLRDRVADNLAKFDITESESLLFGRNFGIGTDIQTGPNGNLFVVSLSNGAVYEIFRRPRGNKGQGGGGIRLAAAGPAAERPSSADPAGAPARGEQRAILVGPGDDSPVRASGPSETRPVDRFLAAAGDNLAAALSGGKRRPRNGSLFAEGSPIEGGL